MGNLYNSIAEKLSKKNINCVIGTAYDLMSVCKNWYRGSVNDFHFYKQTLVDGRTVDCERLTMGMPKKACEDMQKLTWSEKVQITLDNDSKTKKLWSILDSKENSFTINFPMFLERAVYALGTGVLVEYKKNGQTLIDYVDGDVVIPYKYTNSYIYGLITISQFTEKIGKIVYYYTHLTFHEYENRNYIKYHELYKSKDASELGKEIDFELKYADVENPKLYENVDTPHFQVIKPSIANNFDTGSPLGISILANHIDKFKSIDIKYDSFSNEFELGKKMILVDRTAVKGSKEVDETGKIRDVTYFDKNNKVFVAINGMNEQPIKEIDFSLRVDDHVTGINADLNYLSSGIGLGQGYYKFDKTGLRTATEVISENSDTFRTKKNHETLIKDALYDMVQAICDLEGIETKTINIVTDDSIVEDENTLIERGLKLYKDNTISLDTFLSKYLHLDNTQIVEEKEKIMKNPTRVIELLSAEVVDVVKAIDLLFGDSIDEEEKSRMIANLGTIDYPNESEEPKEPKEPKEPEELEESENVTNE